VTDAITDDHMATLLEAARNFAFAQMAHDGRLVPFAAFIGKEGPIDCLRLEDETTQAPLADIYQRTVTLMREAVGNGEALACALVAAIEGGEDVIGSGMRHALSVHLEAPGYCREVLVPYRVTHDEASGEGSLVLGTLVPHPSVQLVFAAA